MAKNVEFTGNYLQVITEVCETEAGTRCYEKAYLRPGVLVVVITEHGQFRFIRERQWSDEQVVTKLVTGYCENDEDPLASAQRELQEELGLTADTWREYLRCETSGAVNKTRYFFIARGLNSGKPNPEPFESILGHVDYSASEVKELALSGFFGTGGTAYVLLRICLEMERGAL